MTTNTHEGTITWSFQICNCRGDSSHGYFHGPDGSAEGDPFPSIESALEALNRAIAGETIPESDRQIVEEAIRTSGLPETTPEEVGESASPQSPPSLVFKTGKENEGSPLSGWLEFDGERTPSFETKYEFREMIGVFEISLTLIMLGVNLNDLIRQINESDLPEGGPAPVDGSTISFRRCTTCSVEAIHGYFYFGEERARVGREMFLSAEDAQKAVAVNLSDGIISAEHAERINGEIATVFAQA